MGKEQPVNPLICKEIRRICEEECGSMFLANFERKAMKKAIEMGIEKSLTHVAKKCWKIIWT
jgi:CRISPR/Cas system-associated endoribonuclease Cas2